MSGNVPRLSESLPLNEEIWRLSPEVLDLIEHLRRENEHLRRQNEDLWSENEHLKRLLDEATRASKRQAAPFSKGEPKEHPKRPGRKAGKRYGKRAERPIPARVDRVVEARLAARCACGGRVRLKGVRSQYQTDIPKIEPTVTRIDVQIGECECCGARLQGRHPEQTSDALGAAANQIGPNALAMAAHMNKCLGVPHAKVARFFLVAFGFAVSKATLVRGLHRISDRAEPIYDEIMIAVRNSPAVAVDETGWKVAGVLWWLWVFVAKDLVLFRIAPSRGFDVPEGVLGKGYAGLLGHDGWKPYDKFEDARHQTCLQHILRRCSLLLERATRGAVRFPRAVKSLIKSALDLRNRHENGEIGEHGLAVAIGKLKSRLRSLLCWKITNADNLRLQKHLQRVGNQLFTFLRDREVEACNWPAEQAIRPAVVNRKISGGNRCPRGARTQEVLTTVVVTCSRSNIEPVEFLTELQRLQPPQELPTLRLLGPQARSPTR